MAKFTLTEEYFSIDPIRVAERGPLTFALYVYLPAGSRIIRVIDAPNQLEKAKLEGYVAKGLKFFYVRTIDRSLYETYITDQAPLLVSAPEAPVVQITETSDEVAIATAEAVEEVKSNELEPSSSAMNEFVPEKSPEEIAKGLVGTPEEHQQAMVDAKDMIRNIIKDAPPSVQAIMESDEAEHATTVAIYSALFVMGMGQKDQGLLQDVIIASLLHDIGMSQVSPEVFKAPETQLDKNARKQLGMHVPFGISMLSELGYKPNARVLTILCQHHERFDGDGYPARLKSFSVDRVAQILHFSDLADTLCTGRYDGVKRTLPEALGAISAFEKQSTFPVHFNPDVFRQIRTWLKGTGADHMAAATDIVQNAKKTLLAS